MKQFGFGKLAIALIGLITIIGSISLSYKAGKDAGREDVVQALNKRAQEYDIMLRDSDGYILAGGSGCMEWWHDTNGYIDYSYDGDSKKLNMVYKSDYIKDYREKHPE